MIKFEHLSKWDIDMIKSMAKDEYVNNNISVTEAVFKVVLNCLHAKGYNIVKDDTREPTWSTPNKSWYAEEHKKR